MSCPAQREEHELIGDCKDGDRSAFRRLYELHADKVYSIALNFFAEEGPARDVTQDVFLKLFTTLTQFRQLSSFSTWLHRIVINACLNEQRRRSRIVNLSETCEPRSRFAGGPEGSFAQAETSRLVQIEIADLEPNLRAVIILRYHEELSYAEIAEVLDWSIGTVSSRLNRAHRLLGKKLGGLREFQ